jgi:hypothetical protein
MACDGLLSLLEGLLASFTFSSRTVIAEPGLELELELELELSDAVHTAHG